MNSRLRVAWLTLCAAIAIVASGIGTSLAGPSIAERLSDDVYVVRDDAGVWGGLSTGMTHQRGPEYWAKKILDLTNVPEPFWQAATQARLSAYFCVRDYSSHDAPQINGLDEAFEIVVNGHVERVPTNSGVPVYVETLPAERLLRWHDFAIPKDRLVRGRNEILFRMVPPEGKKPDDYLYLGIDNTVPGGNSWVRFSKKEPWRQDRITAPDGGKGEYMVRLYLLRGPTAVQASWLPAKGRRDDPGKVLQYAGFHAGPGRMEWDTDDIDSLSPLALEIETGDARPLELTWLDSQGERMQPPIKTQGPRAEVKLPAPLKSIPGGVQFDASAPIRRIALKAVRNYHPPTRRVDMAPHVQTPKGSAVHREPSCRIEGDKVFMANSILQCRFDHTARKLRLASLYSELAAAEIMRRPDDSSLFLVEVDGKRYAGSRDFACRDIAPLAGRQGFSATLFCEPISLEATLSVWVDGDLHLGLTLTPKGKKPLEFKTAFPHLSGLAISDDPAADYYYFPWGGGIISDAPAVIRRGYGDHEAIYQMMDLFSPARGAGLAIWCTDDDGRHKVLALRKHVPGQAETNGDLARTPTEDEFKWTHSLPAVPGVGLTYEYLRRTRKPDERFAAKDVLLRAHPGDWHTAMRAYAEWCHGVWKFRPYPSRLTPATCMVARGWGQDVLFQDGKYRSDIIQPRTDCVELMSWWEWSPLGPWGTPIEQVEKRLGAPKSRMWQAYFTKDPVTGRMMFNNNPGDYDGYNQRWGGLPVLREAIRSYQRTGALVTLYTDPMRCDGNSRCGQQWGKLWGVVKPDGKHRDDYDAWRMCLDTAEYRQWTAQTMRRVMLDTGADGIRLDEHGHCGSACFSKLHQHTFAEWGTTEWQRATAESTRLVRRAMDEVAPRSVLTTEHPGYDYLLQFMEGCITYDVSVQGTPLRPLECNTQRFYFPECKAYELVSDPKRLDAKHHKRFWNAVGSFGSHYPAPMDRVLRENEEVFAGRDCEPLIPTLARFVYANRFREGQKTIYTLYNATGHTFAGPVLCLPLQSDEHLVDLLRGKEADCTAGKDGGTVSIFLDREDVTCLARLPRRLTARRNGDLVEVTCEKGRAWQLQVCDRDGVPFVSRPLADGAATLNLAEINARGRKANCLKLTDGARLADVVPAP